MAAMGMTPMAMAQDEEPMVQFYVHGNPVQSGDRIDITDYYNELTAQYDAHLTCKTTATDDMYVTFDFYKNETTPMDADWIYGAKVSGQICWPLQCELVPVGTSMTVSGEMVADNETNMQLHLGLQLGDEQTYKDLYVSAEFSITAQFDEEEVVLVFFVEKAVGELGSGVEGIESDSNAAPVYYDLQGRKVDNPANGLYIVKKGSKVSKQFIR